MFGMPTPDAWEAVESGQLDVVLGGCCVPVPLVNVACRACDFRWLDAAEVIDASIGGYFGPSYRVQGDGTTVAWTLWVEGQDRDHEAQDPGPEGWQCFWAAVDAAGAWGWDTRYHDPNVLDGTSWSLRLAHEGRAVEASGSNAWPPGWEQLQAALEQLAGRSWR